MQLRYTVAKYIVKPLTALNSLHRDHFDQRLFRNTVEKYSLEIQFINTVAKYIVKQLTALTKLHKDQVDQSPVLHVYF